MLPTLVAVDGGRAIKGVALHENFLYVLRHKSSEQIEVYDKDSYRLQRCLTVHGLDYPTDIAFCVSYRWGRCGYMCMCICDCANSCIHRLALNGTDVKQWPVNKYPVSLSITSKRSVLVICCEARTGIIQEFNTDGQRMLQVQLPERMGITPLRHAIQLSNGKLVVCYGNSGDLIHGVCLIESGGQAVKSYGGIEGSSNQQVSAPTYLAVDRDGRVYVADCNNCRVLLLCQSLRYMREIVSRNQLKGRPERLCLDEDKKCLYVAVGGRLVMVDLRNITCTLL